MKAKVTDWCEGERRLELKDLVPLDTPISILIEPANACNFSCYYCDLAVRNNDGEKTFSNTILSYDLFKKIVSDMKQFPQKVRAINFSRAGEPLINKELPNMIKFAKQEEVCETIKIITNGSLLTPTMSTSLIDAGLDVLRISLQGLTREEYFKNCGYKVDMKSFIGNIKFFYENRNSCKVFIKILDDIVKGREEQFYDIFGDICDEISIEHIIKNVESTNKVEKVLNMFNEEVEKIAICSSPFYTLNICADGRVLPCCFFSNEDYFGNEKEKTLLEIWNGKEMNELRLNILEEKNAHPLCIACNIPFQGRSTKDNIDDCKEKLLKHYKQLTQNDRV